MSNDNTKKRKIKEQVLFCKTLICKLADDIYEDSDEDPYYSWNSIYHHTQKISDAVRIRRELLKLIKLLEESEYE